MYAYLKFMENIEEICDNNIIKRKNILQKKLEEKNSEKDSKKINEINKKQYNKIMNNVKSKINITITKIRIILLNIYIFIYCYIKQIFNIITIKKIYNGYIYIMPYRYIDIDSRNNNINKKVLKNIFKLKKISKGYDINDIVISNKIMQVDYKKSNKKIMRCMVKEIIEYVLNIQNKKIELQDIYILVTEYNKFNEENIIYLSQFFRTTNIVTSKIKEYGKLAQKLEEKYNTLITVTNNTNKSLKKAKYIVNFDMNKDEMNKYYIYRNAIIVNLQNYEDNNIYNRKRI